MESNLPSRLILVIGPPGSGKGTQCKLLAKKFGLLHISAGDLCREMILQQTEYGTKIEPYVSQGQFIPDTLITGIIKERLQKPDAVSQGVLLDGFPRTVQQAQSLVSGGIEVERVILLQISDDICVERILERRTDPVTGETYNLKFLPPPSILDYPWIWQRLEQRAIDTEETIIRDRLLSYHSRLEFILQYFKGKVQPVNADRNIDEVFNTVAKITSEPPLPNEKKPQKAVVEQCVICMSAPAEFLVNPCGHQCGCEGCLSALQKTQGKCPICRHQIDSLVRVFRSGIVDEEENIVTLPALPPPIEQDIGEGDDGGWGEEARKAAQNASLAEYEKKMANDVKIDVAPCVDVNEGGAKVDVAITLQIPDVPTRVPVDVCCVVDISGSMGDDAKFQDPEDETKTRSEGMNILDVVKHAVKTIMHTLTDQDRLAVVAFDSHAVTAFALSEMNERGRQRAVDALEKLRPEDNTNIWAGLLAGLEALRVPANKATVSPVSPVPRKSCILLLTDGQPNQSPPQGEEQALKNYYEKYPDFKCQVNTFGFGYNLNSKLLLDIATRGKGTFGFIPDAKIVGTCFVNAVANICSTLSQNSLVHLVLKGEASFGGDVGGKYLVDKTSWGYVVHLGPLQYGQSRDLIVSMNVPGSSSEYLEVTVEYDNFSGGPSHKVKYLASNRKVTPDAIAAYVRNKVVSTVSDIIDSCEKGNGASSVRSMKVLSDIVAGYNAASVDNDKRLDGLHTDVSGRMTKALSTVERFNRWGKHYLRGVTRSHQLQLRTNFMDFGLQCYGGSLFDKLQEEGGKIFVTLPMKKSNQYQSHYYGGGVVGGGYGGGGVVGGGGGGVAPVRNVVSAPAPAPAPVSNVTYYAGSGGGCFDGSCTVIVLQQPTSELESGHLKEVKTLVHQVKKNDLVRTVDEKGVYGTARVRCVVEIARQNQKQHSLLQFNDSGLKITKKHPVCINGHWCLPKDMSPSSVSSVSSKYVYNFVLDRCHVLLVNGVECATFGHGIEGPVIWHPFYATSHVIDTVASLPGWEEGFVSTTGSLQYLYQQKLN